MASKINTQNTNLNLAFVAVAFIAIFSNIVAFMLQWILREDPCPLCMLQRYGFLFTSLMALLSLSGFPYKKFNLLFLVLGIILTMVIGLRQILLHIQSDGSGYGSPFFGLHLYTWSVVISLLFLVMLALAPLFDLSEQRLSQWVMQRFAIIINSSISVVLLITIMNLIMLAKNYL